MPVPEPGSNQLLVRVHAAALNRGEFLVGHGTHGKPGTWKAIGNEGAGEVVAAGDEVRGLRPGDRVMGRCAGAFAEYALMESAEAMAVPPGLSLEEASAIPLTYLVSFDMLVLQGRLAANEWLAHQRRFVRRRRRLAAAGEDPRRARDRNVGLRATSSLRCGRSASILRFAPASPTSRQR